MSPEKVLRVVQEGMGLAGVMEYPEVAARAGLQIRTVKGVGEHTTVGTLIKIADALELDLVIRMKRRRVTSESSNPERKCNEKDTSVDF